MVGADATCIRAVIEFGTQKFVYDLNSFEQAASNWRLRKTLSEALNLRVANSSLSSLSLSTWES